MTFRKYFLFIFKEINTKPSIRPMCNSLLPRNGNSPTVLIISRKNSADLIRIKIAFFVRSSDESVQIPQGSESFTRKSLTDQPKRKKRKGNPQGGRGVPMKVNFYPGFKDTSNISRFGQAGRSCSVWVFPRTFQPTLVSRQLCLMSSFIFQK